MMRHTLPRRRLLALAGGAALTGAGLLLASRRPQRQIPMEPVTLYTFGDSILDCEHYNPERVHPGQLLVRNDDRLFPEFRDRDLSAHGQAQLIHRATDGATVEGLPRQARDLPAAARAVAILTIGGNDLIRGLAGDSGPRIDGFARAVEAFLEALPIRPVLVGTVYDPTFGDDSRNFLGVEPARARANHRRVNAILAQMGDRYGATVDLHAHFLRGDPSWYTHTIEPSLRGASEVRAAFLGPVLAALGVEGRG